MIVTRHLPSPALDVELTAQDAAARLDGLYLPGRPEWLSVNLVASVNGAARGSDGTSDTLTQGADRRILGAIRRNSSIVLVGASTVRTEGDLFPRSTNLAVATQSGDLTGHAFSKELEPGRLVVVCPAAAVETVHRTLDGVPATVLAIETAEVSAVELIATLRAHGYDTIVCEGGPTLANQLIDAGLVDELCLTTSPVLMSPTIASASAALRAIDVTERHELRLTQLLTDETGAIYVRWSFSARG
ncbi:MAG: dihydrofolate reductase family protein [Cryobacterium sp.]|nr:dihydrofolate reductase family protein [Cryobacterium sp.]